MKSDTLFYTHLTQKVVKFIQEGLA